MGFMSVRRSIRDRFPPPWTVDQTPGGFVVISANGVKLAYTYVKAHVSADGLTDAEALAVARAVARLSTTHKVP